jgi:integrase
MSRHVQGPWYRKSKNAWYATHRGKSVSLGVVGKRNRKAAVEAWRRLLAEGRQPTGQMGPEPDALTVADVVLRFLAHAEAKYKPHTIRTYRRFLDPLSERHGTQPAGALTPELAHTFADRPTWGKTTRHGCLTAIATAFRHAGITLTLDIPPKKSRGAESVVCADTFARLEAKSKGDFRSLLRFLWFTGCRPSEAFVLTLEMVDWDNSVAVLSDHKTAHTTDRPRLIFLPGEAVAVLRDQQKRYGDGFAFRMRNGRGWTLNAAVNRLWRLNDKIGTDATLYGFRHGFATAALVNGLPDAQVAALLGHSNTAMLHRHYSHLTAQAKAMREAVGRVRN